MTKPLVYVAGPYTRPDPVVNTRRAIEVGLWIHQNGGVPVIPHLADWQQDDPDLALALVHRALPAWDIESTARR